jgi:ABC-type multidrug transport system fused ATPase/permease subunit
MFGAFRTVKASGAEAREGERVRAAATEAWRASVRAGKWEAVAGNTGGLAVQAAFIAVLTVGGARVASSAIGVGTLVAFLLYIYYLMPAVNQLAGAVTQYQVGAVAVARIQEAEALPVEQINSSEDEPVWRIGPSAQPDSSALPERVATPPAAVTFDRVSFRYDPELPVVHDQVSVVPPGGMTAFVGPSGAGKTTVFSLIERFYEPGTGRVILDGLDVQAWPLADLRDAIGYVEQDAPVLSGTLRENLLFGAPEAGEDEPAGSAQPAPIGNWLPRAPCTQNSPPPSSWPPPARTDWDDMVSGSNQLPEVTTRQGYGRSPGPHVHSRCGRLMAAGGSAKIRQAVCGPR